MTNEELNAQIEKILKDKMQGVNPEDTTGNSIFLEDLSQIKPTKAYEMAVNTKPVTPLGALTKAIGAFQQGVALGEASVPTRAESETLKSTLEEKKRKASGMGTVNTFENEKKLYNMFAKTDLDFKTVLGSTKNLFEAIDQNTGAATIQAVYSWMKSLDPGGRVTDAEVRLANAMGTDVQTLRARINKIGSTNDPMPEQVKQDLKRIVSAGYKLKEEDYKREREYFTNKVKSYQLDGQISDYNRTLPLEPSYISNETIQKIAQDKVNTAPAQTQTMQVKVGDKKVGKSGKSMIYTEQGWVYEQK